MLNADLIHFSYKLFLIAVNKDGKAFVSLIIITGIYRNIALLRANLCHIAFYYREKYDAKEEMSKRHCFVHFMELQEAEPVRFDRLAFVQAPLKSVVTANNR